MRLCEVTPRIRIRRRDRLVQKCSSSAFSLKYASHRYRQRDAGHRTDNHTRQCGRGQSGVEGVVSAVLEGVSVVEDTVVSVLDVVDVCDVDDRRSVSEGWLSRSGIFPRWDTRRA